MLAKISEYTMSTLYGNDDHHELYQEVSFISTVIYEVVYFTK